MTITRLQGILTEEGEIKVELPPNWKPGKVEVLLYADEDLEWTDEELDELLEYMQFEGKPLGDIPSELIGAGADWDIGDSADWVAEQRRQRQEESRKLWME